MSTTTTPRRRPPAKSEYHSPTRNRSTKARKDPSQKGERDRSVARNAKSQTAQRKRSPSTRQRQEKKEEIEEMFNYSFKKPTPTEIKGGLTDEERQREIRQLQFDEEDVQMPSEVANTII